MEKKDIYEHLAKIYLDASTKKKKNSKKNQNLKNAVLFSVIFIFGTSLALFFSSKKEKTFNSELSLVLLHDTAKINFHFDPARKEIFSLDLKQLDLTRFKSLALSLKEADYEEKISLRIEFTNAFKEKSEVYIKDVPGKWKEFVIRFEQFKKITDWSQMTNLLFAVEEWNASDKKGVVYLDNVRLLK
jgi:hypothetical protein